MNCINLRKRTKKKQFYIYCKVKKKEISYSECRLCNKKEYKQYNPIKKRTSKQAKVEKERFSIIYSDLTKCCVCGSKIGINKHEIFYGKNRQNSMKYGLIIPLCITHHTGDSGIHSDNILNVRYKKIAQEKWEKMYGNRNEFIKIFGRSWL